MVKEQGFNSLKNYNLEKKDIIFPGVGLSGVYHKKTNLIN